VERETGFNTDRGTNRTSEEVCHPSDEVRHLDGLRLEVLPPCKGKHTLRERGPTTGTFDCAVQELTRFRVIWNPLAQEFKVAQNH
jgi:hypothetical protein